MGEHVEGFGCEFDACVFAEDLDGFLFWVSPIFQNAEFSGHVCFPPLGI